MIVSEIKAWLRPFRPRRLLRKLDPHFKDHFLREVSGVVHVGANHGQACEFYDYMGVDVVWIEPDPNVFLRLKRNIRHFKNQRALNALITDVDDREYEFHVANNGGSSSSILDLAQHKDIWPDVFYTSKMKIKGTTLATLLQKERVEAGGYQALVIDTQGTELLVLRGSLPVLGRFRFVKTEVADFEAYAGCCRLHEIESFMKDHGFEEIFRERHASRAEAGSYYDITYERKKLRA